MASLSFVFSAAAALSVPLSGASFCPSLRRLERRDGPELCGICHGRSLLVLRAPQASRPPKNSERAAGHVRGALPPLTSLAGPVTCCRHHVFSMLPPRNFTFSLLLFPTPAHRTRPRGQVWRPTAAFWTHKTRIWPPPARQHENPRASGCWVSFSPRR